MKTNRALRIVGSTILCVVMAGLWTACTSISPGKSLRSETTETSEKEQTIEVLAVPGKYSPTMSSVQGITLSISNPIDDTNIIYNWQTSGGTFFTSISGKESTEYSGESVLWGCLFDESATSSESDTITIKVTAIDSSTEKEVASTSITIVQEGLYYIVQNPE